MEKVYFTLIKAGRRTLDNIPVEFRKAVKKMIDKANENEESN